MDIYEKSLKIIGVEASATVEEVKKAYRKKALSCHPDKHPDNPRAAELFHELSGALEILTDLSARAAYDKILIARRQSKLRTREFDAKRRKFKEDLEAREEAYQNASNNKYSSTNDEQKLQAEIERLQKEGSKLVEEEIALVKKQIWEQLHVSQSDTNPSNYRVKIKWKAAKNDPQNGGYDYDTLYRILYKHGDIAALVVSTTKKGRAMVEYKNKGSAETAAQIEVGFMDNPLTLEGLWYKEKPSFPKEAIHKIPKNVPEVEKQMSDAEYEAFVLNKLRKAQERKRLLEESKTEDLE
ncbi:hypothetical protein KPH14_003110 [Odynerus spinipes]|uniref:J domain-containing protein n=1 Tax=Odynerus spinipes TaxID=1348599 RepID=A0AAD9RXF6_9HYME|nr:hypothetical protein KPH14_003110 [Odynerus spinipes]